MRARLLRFLRRMGWYRGVMGGNRGWMGVFAALFLANRVGKFFAKEPEVAATEKLLPGQSVVISAIVPEKKRKR